MVFQIDINCDLGESFGHYSLGQDEAVLEQITSANIACGYHAGDPNVMRKTVQLAVDKKVAVGAHPGFPDLIGFGRREMVINPDEIFNLMIYQIGALQAFAHLYGVKLRHVKPHGALYNMASIQSIYAEAIAKAVYTFDPDLILFGLAGSEIVVAARRYGLAVAEEVFADRTYQSDGSLTPRSHPNSIIHDPTLAVAQVIKIVKEGIAVAIDGTEIPIQADTVCIHGDHPDAVSFAKLLRHELQMNGIQIQRAGVKTK